MQEDGAPAHAHSSQAMVFALAKVARLLWPGNSPDLNAIEPAWFWLKRRTTALGAATSRVEMERRWLQGWKDLPQTTIQSFIERIPHHIQSIIALDGGNEYEEGIPGFKRSWKGDRLKGKLSSHAFIDSTESSFNTQQHDSSDYSSSGGGGGSEIGGSDVDWDDI